MNRRQNVAAANACGLTGEIVRTFGEVRLRVFGTSMVPSILPGDLISVQRAGMSEISSGEIVLYAREGRLFAHRVVEDSASRLEPRNLVTRGDRLRYNDLPISSSELLGRVTSIRRRGVRRRDIPIELALSLNGWQRMIARLLRYSDQATYFYVRLVKLGLVWTRHAVPVELHHTIEFGQSVGRAECQG